MLQTKVRISKGISEMPKVLFISNMSYRITAFATASIAAAHALGLEFYHASNWHYAKQGQIEEDERSFDLKISDVDIARSPFAFRKNYLAYKQIVKIIRENNIDYIHCNTPVGGILGRLAGKKCKVKKVIYQVHGFHFYKGAPKKNWLLYYPVEKWLARYTDALITINKEDFEFAKKKIKLRGDGEIYYVPGVGIDTAQYSAEKSHRESKRAELGIPNDAFLLISAGELNANKNNGVIISAMERLGRSDIHYVLCGVGELEEQLKTQAEAAGLSKNVHFLGYRNDIRELYSAADCFVMPSYREGLSRSIMEAMSSGLPCIVSKIRGNVDLVKEGKGGYLCNLADVEAYAEAIKNLVDNPTVKEAMSSFNLEKVKEFDSSIVTDEMKKIYSDTFK